MKKLILSIIITTFFTVQVQAKPNDFDKILNNAEQAYKKFDNDSALENYLKLYEGNKTEHQVFVKIVRAYIDTGEDLEVKGDKNVQKNYEMAKKFAEEDVAKYPDKYDSHLYYAMALGRMALFAGGTEKVRLSREVKVQLDKANELNKNYYLTTALIGVYHREIASLNWFLREFAVKLFGGLPKVSMEEAVSYLESSVKENPDFIYANLELAKTYIAIDKKTEAKKILRKLLKITSSDHQDNFFKSEARKLLNNL